MSYAPAHYNAVFEAMRSEFGETWYKSINPVWWNIWRRQLKEKFFDQGILIREIVSALPEAAGKRHWPAGTAFFARCLDVCLKNRIEQRRLTPVQVNKGMEPLKAYLQSFPQVRR